MTKKWTAAFLAASIAVVPVAVPPATAIDYGETCLGVVARPNPVETNSIVTITGKNAVPRSTVRAFLGAAEIASTVGGLGNFSFGITAPKRAGVYTLTVRAKCDLPGTPIRVAQNIALTVEAPGVERPGAPEIEGVTLTGDPDQFGRRDAAVTWAAPTTGGEATGYVVRIRKNGDDTFRTLGTSSTTSLTAKVPYKKWRKLFFIVSASNEAGLSPASPVFTLARR